MNKKLMYGLALLMMLSIIAIAEIVKDVPVSSTTYEYLTDKTATTGNTVSEQLGMEVDDYVARQTKKEQSKEIMELLAKVKKLDKEEDALRCLRPLVN